MEEILFKAKLLGKDVWVDGHYYSIYTTRKQHFMIVVSDDSDMNGYSFEIEPETLSQFIDILDSTTGEKIFSKDVVMVEFEDDEHQVKADGKPLVGFVTYDFGAYLIIESWSCGTEFNKNDKFTLLGNIHDEGFEKYLEGYNKWKTLNLS